jgi:carbonic anhydrase
VPHSHPTTHRLRRLAAALLLGLGTGAALAAGEHGSAGHEPSGTSAPAKVAAAVPAAQAAPPAPAGDPQAVADRIKAALASHSTARSKVQVIVGDESLQPTQPASKHATAASHNKATAHGGSTRARHAALTGHAAPQAHGGEVHWDYVGEHGPAQWGQMKPEYGTCASGKRQSPVHIEETSALQGPAEPLQFRYGPSGGSVVNNGHTIQVDVEGENTLTVRGSTYKLLQFHFHHPAEEKINHKGFSMVAHLVHRNEQGQLGVVAVLIDPGTANPLVHKVWTHMPLDVNDRVRLPAGLIDLNELLPQDQRYYMLMGSLTTPPCTEGVLWMVLKQPATVSRDQLRLFAQLFPMNARPIQALNGRVVRDAQ